MIGRRRLGACLGPLLLAGSLGCVGANPGDGLGEHAAISAAGASRVRALETIGALGRRALADRYRPTTRGFSASGAGFSSITMRARPETPLASLGTTLGARADGELRFSPMRKGELALSLTPLDHRAVLGEAHEGRVVYADVAESTDLAVASGDEFAEFSWLLRDARAPSTFRFRVGEGALGRLRDEGGGGLAVVDDAGHARLHVAPPYAVDARGQRRLAQMSLDDDVLSISLDTRRLAYPIVLDPYVATGVWNLIPVEPLQRAQGALASYGGKLVLFGGKSVTGLLSSTWIYDGKRWSEAKTAHAPSPRQGARMSELGGKLILFGGVGQKAPKDTTAPALSDSWSFDGTDWTQISGSWPDCSTPLSNAVTLGSQIVFAADSSASGSGGGIAMCTFDGTSWKLGSDTGPLITGPSVLGVDGTSVLLATGFGDVYGWSPGSSWTPYVMGTDMPDWDPATAMMGNIGADLVLVSDLGALKWSGTAFTEAAIGGGRAPTLTLLPAFATYGKELYFLGANGAEAEANLWKLGSDYAYADAPTDDAPAVSGSGGVFGVYGGGAVYLDYSNGSWGWDGTQWTAATAADPMLGGASASIADEGTTALLVWPGHTARWTGSSWTTLTTHTLPAVFPPRLGKLGGNIVLVGESDPANIGSFLWNGSDWSMVATAPATQLDGFGGYGSVGVALTSDLSGHASQLTVDKTGAFSAPNANVPSYDANLPPALVGALGRFTMLYAEHESAPTSQALFDGSSWRPVAVAGLPERTGALVASNGGKPLLFGGADLDGFVSAELYRLDIGLEDGIACSAASECASGFCAQGVCCNEACTDAAKSCAQVATLGTCAPVLAACKDALTLVSASGASSSCSPYICQAGACLASCGTSADCAGGFVCNAGACASASSSGGSGGSSGGCAVGEGPRDLLDLRPIFAAFGLALSLGLARRRRARG